MIKAGFRTLFALMILIVVPARVLAQDADDNFYKGKTITIIVSGGGGYESFARTFARHMPNYIAGHPNMIVQLMPGAGGVVAGNYLFNAAPRDGTVIGGVHGNVITAPLLSPDATKFDTTKFSWIGNASRSTYVGFVWNNAPIQTLTDAKTIQVSMGGTSIGGAGIDMAMLGRDLFGFKFKIIAGYKTADETELALERGEIDGMFAHAWADLKTEKPDWLRDGKIRLIVQHGFTKDPDVPDVPLLLDFAQNDLERQILGLEVVRQDVALPYVAPPGIPAGRLTNLRQAFQATLKDPDFLADLKQQNLAINQPMTGEDLTAEVAKVAGTPAAPVKQLQQLLSNFGAGGQ
jgi:tripartite-type tricarboxylate transporter receptor subunit TctC